MASNKSNAKAPNGKKIKRLFELKLNLTPKNIFLWLIVAFIIVMVFVSARDVSRLFPKKDLSDLISDVRNGQVQKIEIKSTIGGNCRIRVPNKVKLVNGKGLNPAKGENPNSLFETAKVKKPIVSAKAKLNDLNLAPTQLYDLMTEAGKTYSFVIK